MLTKQQFEVRYEKIQEEYRRRIIETIGKRDQQIADLFYKSGWTQQKIADHLRKTKQWVSYRLRLARFLAYLSTTVDKPPRNLTEGKFRKLWSKYGGDVTANTPAENRKFQAIVDSEEWEYELAGRPPLNATDRIKEHCIDNKYRSREEIGEELGIDEDQLDQLGMSIQRIKGQHAGGLMVMEKPYAGGITKYKFKVIKNKDATKTRAIQVIEELTPIAEDLSRCLHEKQPHDARENAKGQLHRLQRLIKKYS